MNALNDSTTATPYLMPPLLWGADSLSAACTGGGDWLWQGFLAPGAVTLLTSQWKTGKSTLVSVLLTRMKAGGSLAGKAVVVSEEGPEHWQRRARQLDFGDHVGWFCRPFRGKPKGEEWAAFIDGLAGLHDQLPFSLVVIDPLAAFLPGSENHAGSMTEALLPLQRLTARNLSVLVLHHPSKGDPPIGQAARGSGALAGIADVLIEMRAAHHAAPNDRNAQELAGVAGKHGLATGTLQGFVDTILGRMVFDGEQLTDLLAPLELSWRDRREKELALMDDLLPLLKKLASGREISGLNAYEQ